MILLICAGTRQGKRTSGPKTQAVPGNLRAGEGWAPVAIAWVIASCDIDDGTRAIMVDGRV